MVGRTVSHFKIQDTLGEGGMGKVYLATDIELRRKVALKFLLPQYTENKNIKSRFKIEARTIAALNHPNMKWENLKTVLLLQWNMSKGSLWINY